MALRMTEDEYAAYIAARRRERIRESAAESKPRNAPKPPQSGVSGSAGLESAGFARAGRGSFGDATARRKYGNEPTERDGKRFDSRHEARVYDRLRVECIAGEHAGLARQVAFYLPGGVKYIADFVTLEKDGRYRVYDAKSEATRRDKVYRLKRRQMKECLGIEIQEV